MKTAEQVLLHAMKRGCRLHLKYRTAISVTPQQYLATFGKAEGRVT